MDMDLAADLAATNVLYRCPELYDQLCGDNTTVTALCTELLQRYGPSQTPTVLDLGCGTGRTLAQLAERFRGECVGVDVQPQMVAHARTTHPALDVRLGDVRTVRLGHAVDLIVCTGSVLGYLHDITDLRQAFATFAAHAHPGTLLVLHLQVAPTRSAVTHAPPRTVRRPDLRAEVTTSYAWELRRQVETMHRHWRFDDGRHEHDRIARRILGPRELDAYLAAAGFQVLAMFDHPSDRQRPLAGPGAYTLARAT